MATFKKLIVVFIVFTLLGLGSGLGLYFYYASTLPPLFSVSDYEPLLVSEVYARDGEKIGEFYRENRKLVEVEDIPQDLINAFLAAEDSDFYTHNGFNFKGMLRAFITNLTSGQKSQGASTITQQTARTLFLSSEKTYTRKFKEAIMARRMEKNLSKEEILYLYLNQIYFGQGAHGVASAAETFYRKKVKELTLAEMAILAGSLTAPSAYNIVANPKRAKIKQQYVLKRMLETERIDSNQYDVATNEVLKVYRKKSYKEVAPYFVETIRQLLVKELGEEMVLDKGLKIYSSLDYQAQKKAQESLRTGLRDVDKRQGYRGPLNRINVNDQEELIGFLTKERNKLIDDAYETFEVFADGSTNEYDEFKPYSKKNDAGEIVSNIPPYTQVSEIVKAVVTKVDDTQKLVFVRFAESQGIIPLSRMAWARKPDANKTYSDYLHIKKPSEALTAGDVIEVLIVAPTALKADVAKDIKINLRNYAELSLEQEPLVEGAILSYDLKTDDIIAMEGGSNFRKTKLNRTYQAVRQSGSAFKAILYAAGLDKGFTPASAIMGSPIVYNQQTGEAVTAKAGDKIQDSSETQEQKVWKPGNYSGRFTGDILLRNALKKSLNTPTIRILEKIGVSFAAEYARRLGFFSPVNMDLSMALGSNGATLYELTKAYSVFARLGKNIKPVIIHEIKDRNGEILAQEISFDLHFKESIGALKDEFKTKREAYEANVMKQNDETQKVSPFFFNDPDQLISPQTAYLTTTLLQAVVNEAEGTGARARSLNREVAGKTGTTNGYFDAWFIGYTPQVSTGVWVGFDQEKSLGRGEAGSRAALPIWLDYMTEALKDYDPENFSIPNNIVFANIDNETGRLANARTHEVVRQAFITGTEPGLQTEEEVKLKEEEEKTDFYREEY